MVCLFRDVDPSVVVRDPFPHICVENLIDDRICCRLVTELGSADAYTKGRTYSDDEKMYRSGAQLLADPELSSAWRQVITDNMQPAAFWEFYRVFREDIAREFPTLPGLLSDQDLRIGQRSPRRSDPDRDNELDILMEVQLVYFMPIKGALGAERGPHLKTSEKIFNSFFCLRLDGDDSTGGEHVLYRVRSGNSLTLKARNQVDPEEVISERIIPRRRNVFVGYLNTRRSVTAMTPRSNSPLPAVYLNLLVEFSPRLWQSASLSQQRW